MNSQDIIEPMKIEPICSVLKDLDFGTEKYTTFNSITAVVVKELRMQSRHSQRSFAEQLGVPHQTYAKIEQGNTRINIDTLFRIANVYNINKAPQDKVFSAVIVNTVGLYSDFLTSTGWEVLSSLSDAKEPSGDDLFMARANEYYKLTAKQIRWEDLPILRTPMQDGAFQRGLEVFHEAGCIFNPNKNTPSQVDFSAPLF